MIPIALDAQCSSFVPPQHAMPIWYTLNSSFPYLHHASCVKLETLLMLNYIRDHGVSQQQINDQVLMDASNASTHADLDISMLLPEAAIPYQYVFFH